MTNVRALVCLVLLVTSLHAQAPAPAARQTFDVISIKPTATGQYPPGMASILRNEPGGRFLSRYISAADLISYAFKPSDRFLRAEQILGGPDWMRSARFEVTATTGTDISPEAMAAVAPAMVRAMLEDRFKLKAHLETRQQPVWALVRAKPEGALGPQLRRTLTDCEAYQRELAANPRPRTFVPNAPLAPCSASRGGGGKYSARGMTMQAVARELNASGRAVIDSTGLPGLFDVDLEWVPDSLRVGTANDAPLSDGPSIFTAVQEQLGLKLESSQEQRPVVVVDSIERPTPD